MKIMRNLALTAAFIAGTTLTSVSQADELTDIVKAACEAEACLYSQMKGQPDIKECKNALKSFFKIEVKKKGKFNPAKTEEARKEFLDNCPSGNIAEKDPIIKKFGRKKGF